MIEIQVIHRMLYATYTSDLVYNLEHSSLKKKKNTEKKEAKPCSIGLLFAFYLRTFVSMEIVKHITRTILLSVDI